MSRGAGMSRGSGISRGAAISRDAGIGQGAGGLWDDIWVEVTPRGVSAVRLDGKGDHAGPHRSANDETPPGRLVDDAHGPIASDAHAILAPETLTAETLTAETLKQLREYLRGDRTRFELPLDLSGATPFRRSVWEALLDVPFGSTVSYKELARRVGCNSPRAVGQAVGANPLGIIVPCHRVVTSDGRLGGYSGGLDRKVALLAIEGIEAGSSSFSSRIAAAA